MTKSNLTTVLKAVENLVKRNRVAYRDFLGEETKTVQYCHGVIGSEEEIIENGGGDLTDDGGGELVLGETYQLTIDGVTRDIVATAMAVVVALDEERGIGVGFRRDFTTWIYMPMSVEAASLLAGKTISLSKTTTEKKYKTKLLPDYLLPSWLRKDKIVTKGEVNGALMTADAAQFTAETAKTTADAAQFTAETAKTTADAAQFTAETAKTTAETAKTTAETAKTTADAAMTTAETAKNGVFQNTSQWDNKPFPTSVMLHAGKIYSTDDAATVGVHLRYNGTASDVYNEAIISILPPDPNNIERNGPVLNFSGRRRYGTIGTDDEPVCLNGISGIIMSSSTPSSTKQFKITVNDTGTLSATEVTS